MVLKKNRTRITLFKNKNLINKETVSQKSAEKDASDLQRIMQNRERAEVFAIISTKNCQF